MLVWYGIFTPNIRNNIFTTIHHYTPDASTQTDYTNTQNNGTQTDVHLITQELSIRFDEFNCNLELNNQDIKQVQRNQIIQHSLMDSFTHSLPTTFQHLTQNLDEMVHISHKFLDQADNIKETFKPLENYITQETTKGLQIREKQHEDIQQILDGIYLIDNDLKNLNIIDSGKHHGYPAPSPLEEYPQLSPNRSPSLSPSPPPYSQHKNLTAPKTDVAQTPWDNLPYGHKTRSQEAFRRRKHQSYLKRAAQQNR